MGINRPMTENSFANRSVLITGASGAIGAALARRYAHPDVSLFLSGRNGRRLEDVAQECTAQGADVYIRVLDVTNRAGVADWVTDADRKHPLGLVVANAGVYEITGGYRDEEQIRHVFDVNVTGVLNTVLPALPLMRRRGSGQIAIVSSIAGFRGLPMSPAYSASKVGVRAWAEALRPLLAPEGIKVSVICPGYVASPMTDKNKFPMPFLMSADRAASVICRGLERNKSRIVFPFPMHLVAWGVGALPPVLTDWFLGRVTRWRLDKEK